MTAEATDYTATYYNPSLLVNAKAPSFGTSFQWFHTSAQVTKTVGAAALDCSVCAPPDAPAVTIGGVALLGGRLKNRVALGIGLLLPTSNALARLNTPNTTQPFWYRYQANPERFGLHAGLAIKLFDFLNIGAGFHLSAEVIGDGAHLQVDAFSKQVLSREIDLRLNARASPIFGITIVPWKRLRIGASFRWELSLPFEIPASVDLQGVARLDFNIKGITHYNPHTLQFGMAYDIIDQLTVTIDGEWKNWSAAPTPYLVLDLNLSGEAIDALGLGKAFDLQSARQLPGFTDTLTGRIGIEYRISKRAAARAGGVYRPTMVPRQNVPGTNLLDGSAVGVGAGLGFNFDDPLEILGQPLFIDVAGQGTFIFERETQKELNDVVPSYTYSAQSGGLSVALRYDF